MPRGTRTHVGSVWLNEQRSDAVMLPHRASRPRMTVATTVQPRSRRRSSGRVSRTPRCWRRRSPPHPASAGLRGGLSCPAPRAAASPHHREEHHHRHRSLRDPPASPRAGRRHRRQHGRVVRLVGLRVLRPLLRGGVLPAGRRDRPAVVGVRRVRGRLLRPPAGRGRARFVRRPPRTPRRHDPHHPAHGRGEPRHGPPADVARRPRRSPRSCSACGRR